MANFYNLPGGAPAGMCDAKMPDFQAGYEKGISAVLAGLAGANLVYEAAGMHASLMGFCLESLIVDNDMLGQALRCVRGIEVNTDTLSVATMHEVCTNGAGHYLGDAQTLALMQSEYIYPAIGNRMSPKEWLEAEKPEIIKTAIAEKRHLLATRFPDHIPRHIDNELRERFDILLPRKQMSR